MESIFETAGNLGSVGALILLVFLLLERLIGKGYLKIGKSGFGKDEQKKAEEMPEWAVTLSGYFNHDTTKALNEIAEANRNICKKLDVVISKQEEMMKYGVPNRDNK